MGKYDDAMYQFLSDDERFVDLFNGVLFGGQQVLCAEALEGDSERYVLERPDDFQPVSSGKHTPSLKMENRFRDIKKRMKCGTGISVLAIENQATIDHTMPWRIMQYDCMEYHQQIRTIENRKRRRTKGGKKKRAGFETKFSETDKLHPVYTLCLYHGTESWNGPRSLKDMMDCAGNEELCRALFHDYRMTLVCVEDLKDLSVFRTDLRLLLETLAVRKARNKMKELFKGREFSNLSVETARTIAIMADNTQVLEKIEHDENNEKGEVNMCQAWDEILEECKEQERVSSIRSLKENLKMTTEQAMNALNIPENMFAYYSQLV